MKHYLSILGAFLLAALIFGSPINSQVIPQPGPPTPIACAYNTSPTTLTNGQAGWVQCDSAGKVQTAATLTPSGTQDVNQTQVNGVAVSVGNGIAGTGVQRVSIASDNTAFNVNAQPATAVANQASTATNTSNQVLKASAGSLLTLTTTIGATSGYLMLFDATALPSNGAVTPKYCLPVNSNGTNGAVSAIWNVPLSFSTGITAGFSTTGCFTLTASATALGFFGQIQ